MGWFDSQLKQREKKDLAILEDAYEGVAGAVLGKRLSKALENNAVTNNALDEIFKYYKIKETNIDIPVNVKSIDEQIEYRIRPYGILKREVYLDKGWYQIAFGAMLGTLKSDGRAIALIPAHFRGYYYYDFVSGEKVRVNRKNADNIDTRATCFYQPLPLKELKVHDLLGFVKTQLNISDLILIIGIAVVTTLLGMLSPLFTKWLFGSVLESKSVQLLACLAVFMLTFSITKFLVDAFNLLIKSQIETKIDITVGAAVMNRILSLPTSFFNKYSSGELAVRSQYVSSVCTSIVQAILNCGITTLLSLTYIFQIFAFSPALVLPAFLILAVNLLFSLLVIFRQMKISTKAMIVESKENGMTYSMITGIQKIKLSGSENRMFSRWASLYKEEALLTYNPPLMLKIQSAISLGISSIGLIIIYAVALHSNVSISDYYAFNTAFGMVSSSLLTLTSVARIISVIKPSLDMAKPIMETVPEFSEGKELISSIQGSIEISNVSFRYSEEMPNVINNLSLKIRSGEYVGIVGKTGCGKSTLIRLLLGFEKPQKGSIFFDNKDINTIDVKSLRKKMGVVMQNSKLFMGDIYSNIVVAAPETTLEGAWEAAEIASVAENIRRMPMGMDTIISEGGGGISGGQKQRLMIARAVAGKPKILIFDEATSALDNVAQARVSDSIDKLKCTRIVIAHRLSTIKNCDRIIVLDNGNIIEEGKYDELISKKGFFADLVERQRVDIDLD